MTEQEKREKIIKGLELCSREKGQTIGCLLDCPYDGVDSCYKKLMRDAIALLKAQEPRGKSYWVHCNGKSHIWYCAHCGEKINYNNAHKFYKNDMKPIEQVNHFCRACGYEMTSRPTDEQREAEPWA